MEASLCLGKVVRLKNKIAITGGSGFVGRSLTRYLAVDFDVKVIDIERPPSLPDGADFEQCDVRDYPAVSKSMRDADLAIHAAIIQIPQINQQRALAYEVNISGTQNVCKVVAESERTKGMILASSWHSVGERGIAGTLDESIGYRPDKVEPRARLYALSKIAQEVIVRFYDESSPKTYGIVRMGTVLGDDMPRETAASLFLDQALTGRPITPYLHSMNRPMLFVDVDDICTAYKLLCKRMLGGKGISADSFAHIFNVFYPQPFTVLDLAQIVRDSVERVSGGQLSPKIELIDGGLPAQFEVGDKDRITVDTSKLQNAIGMSATISAKESIERIARVRFARLKKDEKVHPSTEDPSMDAA